MKKYNILAVDDEEDNLDLLRRTFRKEYNVFTSTNGYDGLKLMERIDIALIITDQRMPGMTGIQLLEKTIERYPNTIRIILTAYTDVEDLIESINTGRVYKYITKPWDNDELKITVMRALESYELANKNDQLIEDLQQALEKLRESMEKIIQIVSRTIEKRDPYTAGHQSRVANLSHAIAEELGFSKDQIDAVYMAGLIHDLGKISIPSEILSKPTALTEIEFSIIKSHPQVGYEILKDVEFNWPIAQILHQHHERLDGSGYPNGLSAKDIQIEAKVLAVADVVEAMSSHRPYREAIGRDKALDEIVANKGIFYDPVVVDACLRLLNDKKYKL